MTIRVSNLDFTCVHRSTSPPHLTEIYRQVIRRSIDFKAVIRLYSSSFELMLRGSRCFVHFARSFSFLIKRCICFEWRSYSGDRLNTDIDCSICSTRSCEVLKV